MIQVRLLHLHPESDIGSNPCEIASFPFAESRRLATITFTPLSRRFWAWAWPCDLVAKNGKRFLPLRPSMKRFILIEDVEGGRGFRHD